MFKKAFEIKNKQNNLSYVFRKTDFYGADFL